MQLEANVMISLHYNQMVQQFVHLLEADWNANEVLLKDAFETRINSRRGLEAIHSLLDLIKVLEKREEVNEDSIEALNIVASVCDNREAASLLQLYKAGKLLLGIPVAATEEGKQMLNFSK